MSIGTKVDILLLLLWCPMTVLMQMSSLMVLVELVVCMSSQLGNTCLHVLRSNFMVLVMLVVCMSSCLAEGVGEVGCLHVLMFSLMVLVNFVVCMSSQLGNACLHVLRSNLMVLVRLVVCMSSCLAEGVGEVGCLHVLMSS